MVADYVVLRERRNIMYSVGIDISKGKSTFCILSEYGEAVQPPQELFHTDTALKSFVSQLKGFGGPNDVRVIMEATGIYHRPVSKILIENGIFVSIVNPLVMKKYRATEDFRGAKTDKLDCTAIAIYGLDKWMRLKSCGAEDSSYIAMRALSRQYLTYQKPAVQLTQNLDHIIDQVMPGIKDQFDGYDPVKGKDPMSDFLKQYIHYGRIIAMGPKRFETSFRAWAKKKGYRPHSDKSTKIYALAKEGIPTLADNEITKKMVLEAIQILQEIHRVLYEILTQMRELASQRPEYEAVCAMSGVGDVLAPLLIAEVGDPRKYHCGKALTACTGLDVPPYESGQFKAKNRRITKKGSANLRKVTYLVVQGLIKIKPKTDTAVYDYVIKKKDEGKPYKVAIVAGMNKFLRIYYARAIESYSAS
jgi:transposase